MFRGPWNTVAIVLDQPLELGLDAKDQVLLALTLLVGVITLGTGLGSGVYVDGKLVPNLELGHHPLRKGKTYEDYVSKRALEKVGERRWNKRVRRIIAQVMPIWNPRILYIGGGNSRLIHGKLPDNVRVVDNIAGILGGIRLWQETRP